MHTELGNELLKSTFDLREQEGVAQTDFASRVFNHYIDRYYNTSW